MDTYQPLFPENYWSPPRLCNSASRKLRGAWGKLRMGAAITAGLKPRPSGRQPRLTWRQGNAK